MHTQMKIFENSKNLLNTRECGVPPFLSLRLPVTAVLKMDIEQAAFPVHTSRIAVDATFDSFEEFYEHYFQWLEEGSHPFTVQKSHCSENPRIKYLRVKYSCVHRGTPTYRGQGKRPNQTYLGQNCQAFLNIKYDKARDKIVVKALNDQHNHETGPAIYQTYRQNRRLNTTEITQAKQLIESNVTPEMVAKTISQISGKVISKKDVYNLQNRIKTTVDEKKPSRRHFRDLPAPSVSTISLPCDVDYEDEVTITSQPNSESEDSDHPKSGRGRKRKTAEDSAMQSLLESTLADVVVTKSDLLTLVNLPNMVGNETDPIQDFSEVTISSSTLATPIPSTSKRLRTTPTLCVNPLGTKLNLIRLHEEGLADIQVVEVGGGDGTVVGGDVSSGATVKPTASVKPGQKVFIKSVAGVSEISRSDFVLPKVTSARKSTTGHTKKSDPPKSGDLADALIAGLARVAPARQLSLLAQICRSWKEHVTTTLSHREHPIWMLEHLVLVKESRIEDLLPNLELQLRRLAFEPRFVLSFVSASLFRPQFGPCDRRFNCISAFKDLLPKRSVLCEIYGVGIVGSASDTPSRTVQQIVQVEECNVVGGVSALLLPAMRHVMPVCLVLDAKRLKEIEASSDGLPSYIEQTLGPYRPPLRSLLLFEHGSPAPATVKKFYDYLLDSHPHGFAFSGVEVCQSKVDAAIYTAEHQWGPTIVAVGFLGDCVLSTSIFFTEAENADKKLIKDSLTDWRKRLLKSTFAKPVGYIFDHFCFAFYSDKDQSECSPISLFTHVFPEVPLLGVQANGTLYGHTMDVAHLTEDVHKAARTVLERRSDYACTFCIVSVPRYGPA